MHEIHAGKDCVFPVRAATRAARAHAPVRDGRAGSGPRRRWRGIIGAGLSLALVSVAAPALAAKADPPGFDEGETLPERESGEAAGPPTAARARAPTDADRVSGLSGGSFTVMANATLASEYRFRGVDLSGGDPALQGGIDVVHASGFYAGTWASTIDDDTVGYGALELDVYGGWSGDVAEGLNAGIGVIAYTFPDAGAGDFDYVELYGSLGFTLGPAQASVGAAWDVGRDGLDFGGLRRDNLYLYTDLSAGLPGTPVTVNAHLGYTDGAVDFAGESVSFDWSLGADWAIRDTPLVLGVAYVDAAHDVQPPGAFNPTSSTLLATLSAYF